MTGYLALFVGSLGFLTRAFIESIDEASLSAVEALRATGATYFQIVYKAVGFELFMASVFYFDMREVGLITYMILILAIVLELTSTRLKNRYFPATSTK